ncbi:MAG: hypothetical protein Q9198_009628 [Flavoplaca austrocitrina]
MSHQDLKSVEQKKQDEEFKKENMKNAEVAKPERSISNAFTCGKCGLKKVAYSQAQTRSADEPMTTFCECQNCGNRWKRQTLIRIDTRPGLNLGLTFTPATTERNTMCTCKYAPESFDG